MRGPGMKLTYFLLVWTIIALAIVLVLSVLVKISLEKSFCCFLASSVLLGMRFSRYNGKVRFPFRLDEQVVLNSIKLEAVL